MECKTSDSKKIFKVFDASKRKHTRKKRDGFDDSKSLVTDDSANGNGRRVASAKTSEKNISNKIGDMKSEVNSCKSSPSVSPVGRRGSSSPRRHRRPTRDGISLALKAGLVSTPRSVTPRKDGDAGIAIETIPQDQDSFIYAFLEDAVKRDKRKQRHARRHTDACEREEFPAEHRHRRRRHRERCSRDRDSDRFEKEDPRQPPADQAALLETFAKLCAQLSEKTTPKSDANQLPRTQSHKSLQCEVIARRDSYNKEPRPERLQSRQFFRDNTSPSRIRSHDNFQSQETNVIPKAHPDDGKSQSNFYSPYDKENTKYASKVYIASSRVRATDSRYHQHPREISPPRVTDQSYYRPNTADRRDYRDYVDRREAVRERPYEDKRMYCEQKTSRSFDVHREAYDERPQRTVRSDRDKYYDTRDYREKRYDSPRSKYYDDKPCRDRKYSTKERSRRNLERFERNSVASRDDERFSERERDSGYSVADGETSTISGRSNCLRVVKQEISEQKEAMDKMMKLWKELMRCFKSGAQAPGQPAGAQETAASMRESAAAQLRLWRECMRRYETVARDVGDTDARLMEEINKQRLEMSEMASMWQECLQRYRDMSSDFNSLKQQLTTPESPTRLPAPPLLCAEGEPAPPASPAPYRPPHYPPHYPPQMAECAGGAGYAGAGGSPLRARASAPPAWWWGEAPRTPRRRSSPDSRGSRERARRHRERDRHDARYKEKAKPNGARSEHKHRKR